MALTVSAGLWANAVITELVPAAAGIACGVLMVGLPARDGAGPWTLQGAFDSRISPKAGCPGWSKGAVRKRLALPTQVRTMDLLLHFRDRLHGTGYMA